MASNNVSLRDGWTHDPDYRRYYQTADDVDAILGLLALEAGSVLADIGCGNGAFAIAAARSHPDCLVWAFDALASAVAECKTQAEGLPNLHVDVAWAHSVPLDSSTVDRVLFRSVLHHVPEPQPVYAEIYRLLRPGGRLALQAPCNGWDGALGHVLSEMMMLADDSHRRFYYQPAEITAGLQAVGLSAAERQCWPYAFPFLDNRQAEFVRRHHAEEKLRLQPLEPGKWSIEGCWIRIVADKPLHTRSA